MTDINDIQIKADQYLENKEYQQAIDYFKKVRKQNLGISKIDYLIYRNAIEKYKYEKETYKSKSFYNNNHIFNNYSFSK